jgi:hypothetical protein
MAKKTESIKKRASSNVGRRASGASKIIRDSFTMPMVDYDLIASLKKRCISSGVSVNKSQLLRAGLNALNSISDKELIEIINQLIEVKPGRRAAS